MPRIYLDPGVIALGVGAGEPGTGQRTVPAPGAAEALGYLADTNYQLVMLGGDARPSIEGLPVAVATATEVPDQPEPGSWLITDDPDECLHRPPGLRTILVGPKRAPSHRPAPRCDLEARDLSAAVIEILAREAMA